MSVYLAGTSLGEKGDGCRLPYVDLCTGKLKTEAERGFISKEFVLRRHSTGQCSLLICLSPQLLQPERCQDGGDAL